jgi:hypothetical protein
MLAICGTKVQGLLDGSKKQPSKTITKKVDDIVINEPNPAYDQWVAVTSHP